MIAISLSLLFVLLGQPPKADAPKPAAHPAADLRLRSIGPATLSGRIVGFAVHPEDKSHYYIAVGSGGVWKTTNAGITWTPVFDSEGSYSIGCVVLDPKNPNVVWVGTGENNSQRSVGYGDGVYKSVDGGRSWKNVGLKESEHIGRIVIDPRDSETVYVAAQGPLWGPGGDRGLYKTTDGGKTWTRLLNVSENTGITDLVQDPRNPDVMLAAAYQRRRHVYTIVNGGPESGLHRTTDGGKTWTPVRSGLPGVELGRIGLAVAPSRPDTVYAIVEAAEKQGGLYRSTDRGQTWQKRNGYDEQGQYYSRVIVDPTNADRVYQMNTFVMVSDDGGKTITPLGERAKHVDTHDLWIDPKDPKHLLSGCDGGLYESFDRGEHWRHSSNMPVTQFYDVAVEQVKSPFYKVYGGTQDNNTFGGPARTMSAHGITSGDWHVIVGGDGFQVQIDPDDPNTVYAESQYGGLVRYDWRTGQRVAIQPKAAPGDPLLRWNWDSPLLISPHNSKRIYFCANRVFRSDDRGDSWKAVSGDLSRGIDRDTLPVFGKVQPPEAVFKNGSTSFFGNITAFSESPLKEGLLYAGTDDGLVQVSADGGGTWARVAAFPGVPDMTYVSRLVPSRHDADTVYATFDNHKNADFKPYVMKSVDAGKTWTAIANDLPARGSVYAFAEDHVDPKLLFVGTEFGMHFTVDGGRHWQRLRNGLPTIAVRDLAIQRHMNDLVVATFGRGFYVIDDYSALRHSAFDKPATILPIRDAFIYPIRDQFGGGGKATLGETFFTSDNPTYGATITYHVKDETPTAAKLRKDAAKGPNPMYPKLDALRDEAEEESPAVLATIADSDGNPVRTLTGSAGKGLHRLTWDLRISDGAGRGRPAPPGKYSVSLSRRVKGEFAPLAEAVTFEVKDVGPKPLPEADMKALVDFQKQVNDLQRDLSTTNAIAEELTAKLERIKDVLDDFPAAPAEARQRVRKLIESHRATLRALNGDSFLEARWENTPMSIGERVGTAGGATRGLFEPATGTQREQYKLAREELDKTLAALRQVAEKDVKSLEELLDKLGAPWTPGRLPAAKK